MNLAPWQNGGNRIKRRHDTVLAIVLHAQITILSGRILPGDDENGMPLLDQVPNHGVVGRQIKDVVLHDPGGHDQDRFGVNLRRRGLVLDQLHQVIAENNLARCDRHVAPHYELFRFAVQRLAGDDFLHVGHEVIPAAHQILAAFFHGGPENFRVGQWGVRWREHVQNLPGHKRNNRFVLLVDTPVAGSGVVPPLLSQQKGLINEVVRPLPPALVIKPVILRQRFNAGLGVGILAGFEGVEHQAHHLANGFFVQQRLLARRQAQVHQPVEVGHRDYGGRNTAGAARQIGVDHPVNGFRDV